MAHPIESRSLRFSLRSILISVGITSCLFAALAPLVRRLRTDQQMDLLSYVAVYFASILVVSLFILAGYRIGQWRKRTALNQLGSTLFVIPIKAPKTIAYGLVLVAILVVITWLPALMSVLNKPGDVVGTTPSFVRGTAYIFLASWGVNAACCYWSIRRNCKGTAFLIGTRGIVTDSGRFRSWSQIAGCKWHQDTHMLEFGPEFYELGFLVPTNYQARLLQVLRKEGNQFSIVGHDT